MGHSNVWNSHPKNYGQGSRTWDKFCGGLITCPHESFQYLLQLALPSISSNSINLEHIFVI
ncbi:40S ribosomal protein S29 [Platanthera guangdongensis]|uniref:40S ribosomal protein S29 n=1 Tax=Platanthera guangdongensis TaxID=2320717 RepID=A0ABR2MDX0_9ASPA